MTSALIGHTGFVGSTLLRQTGFDACFNTKNIQEMRGQSFDLVVCCGVSAVKWLANREPEKDWAGIAGLIDVLGAVKAKEFVLVSSVDVYASPAAQQDEAHNCILDANHPYGRHRLAFEHVVAGLYDTVRIVRLPALFGAGLKKNIIYDLLGGNMLDAINPASAFQWYDMSRLWSDLSIIRDRDLRLVNLMAEPVATGEILAACFPGTEVGAKAGPSARYDTCTRHGRLFGGDDRYAISAADSLAALARFVAAEKAARGQA